MKRLIPIILAFLIVAGCGKTHNAIATDTMPQTEPVTPPLPNQSLMEGMSDEELVGQLFLARFPDAGSAVEDMQNHHLGGYILFRSDIKNETPFSLSYTLTSLQNNAAIPLVLAVDEEGGTVCRVSLYPQYRSERFPSPRALYAEGGLEGVLNAELEKCHLLRSLGINTNMAPVCDVTTNPKAFMYKRSLGQSPETTGEIISAMVKLMDSQGVGSVLKHFPGYGNNTDTHIGTAADDRPLEQFEKVDLVPFRAGIEAGCHAILVSHTTVACFDATLPASLSPKVMQYLRNNLGFQGVIVTDDLAMDAITDTFGVGESAVLAILAGNDLLCSSDYKTQYHAVLAAVKEGRITRDRLYESVRRILLWKEDLGLMQ